MRRSSSTSGASSLISVTVDRKNNTPTLLREPAHVDFNKVGCLNYGYCMFLITRLGNDLRSTTGVKVVNLDVLLPHACTLFDGLSIINLSFGISIY